MTSHNRGFVSILLIIVGLLLALALIGFFTQNVKDTYDANLLSPNPTSTITPPVTSSSNPPPTAPPAQEVCGLIVQTPAANASVSSPLVVQGYANGCGWDVVNGHLATVQLFSSTNVPVTTAVPVSLTTGGASGTAPFFTTLVYPDTSSALSGYLLFTHEGTVLTKRVDIKY